jgi:ABC-type transport system involved in multi-copper enzyme maturation permease subunit
MKYLAIFKDSIREAIDLKIFYLVVFLSVLFSLVVGTTSLKPVPMSDALERFSGFFNFLTKNKSPEAAKLNIDEVREFEIAEVVRINDGTEPWTGKYRFTLKMHLWEVPAKDAEAEKGEANAKKKTKLTDTNVQAIVSGMFPWFAGVSAKRKPSADAGAVEFEVSSLGMQPAFRTRETWYHYPCLLFGLIPVSVVNVFPLSGIVSFLASYLVGNWGAGATMLLSCIVTAFFIPNVLAKGTIDLLIVRPISRPMLFACKFMGGMSFMLLNTAIIIVGIWFGLGLQTEHWLMSLLLCIPVYTFQFAIFYSVSALVGVVTRSPIVCILAVMFVWVILVAAGWTHWFAVERPRIEAGTDSGSLLDSEWYEILPEVVHAVLPRYKDIDWLTARDIRAEMLRPSDMAAPGSSEAYEFQLKQLGKQYGNYTWPPALAVSSLFIVVMLVLAVWRFTSRDY